MTCLFINFVGNNNKLKKIKFSSIDGTARTQRNGCGTQTCILRFKKKKNTQFLHFILFEKQKQIMYFEANLNILHN